MSEINVISPESFMPVQKEETPKLSFPTAIVDLPSKGLLYPEGHPLKSGTVEIKYMTAKEEDILSTRSYIDKGIVLDKLLESIIVTKFDYNSLLLGDRNAIMIAARIYGYGPEYKTKIKKEDGSSFDAVIDLNSIQHKVIDESLINSDNLFELTLPVSKKKVTIELFTVGKYKQYEESMAGLKKIKSFTTGEDQSVTTMYRYIIKSIEGIDEDHKVPFINNMVVADTRALRNFINKIQPDINLEMELEDPDTGATFLGKVQLGLSLFYPDIEQ